MPRYKFLIEYLGTNYCGWQMQKHQLSIQELITEAIFKFSGEQVQLIGAGRTDAGVHAIGQIAHCDFIKDYEPYTIKQAINFYLFKQDISIVLCEKTNEHFHARFSAKKRSYLYKIINRDSKLAIYNNLAWQVRHPLNINSMSEAAKYLEGCHDFTSFRTIHCQAKSPIKTIDNIYIEKLNNMITIHFKANSYLHHMVRNITSTLVHVGLNKIDCNHVKTILMLKNRKFTPATAPACGLYFEKVEY